MPNNYTTPQPQPIGEDEINLRELFATIGRYKWSIMLMTLIITIITAVMAYRMPKYYQTTTVIEVKPKSDDKSGGFSLGALGGAGALLGLSGLGGSSSTTDKDAAMLGMFRTNKYILDSIDYTAQYFINKQYRDIELTEGNSSIHINNLHITNYQDFGMEIGFTPIAKKSFHISALSKLPFLDENLGTFEYGKPIHTPYFNGIIYKKNQGTMPTKVILNADKHFIFNDIISKNLSTEVGGNNIKSKADLPFVTISFRDTLPSRGESYLQALVKQYVQMSIADELDEINISLSSINQQIYEMKAQAQVSALQYQSYKSSNSILAPEVQAEVLIKEKALVDSKLLEYRHKLSLVKKLIISSKKRSNIDTMAPALAQLGDEVTAGFIGKIQELQIEESALRQEFKAAYPKLKAVRHQISSLRNKIRTSLKSLQKILTDEISLMKKERTHYLSLLKQAPKLETELAPLTRDYKLYETMHTYLLQKRSSLELKKAEALSRFRTIDPIYTNPAPVKPKKALIVIIGFIMALIFSILLTFFREFLKGD